jgi:hypothetical protein
MHSVRQIDAAVWRVHIILNNPAVNSSCPSPHPITSSLRDPPHGLPAGPTDCGLFLLLLFFRSSPEVIYSPKEILLPEPLDPFRPAAVFDRLDLPERLRSLFSRDPLRSSFKSKVCLSLHSEASRSEASRALVTSRWVGVSCGIFPRSSAEH